VESIEEVPVRRGIVVGVDGSQCAGRALRWAVDEGRRRDVPVVAALAWSYLDQHDPEQDGGFDPAYTEGDARDALHAYVEDVLGDAHDVRHVVACDAPDDAIAGLSSSAALVVVGAHGDAAFPDLRLGSTSDAVLRKSACPVVVVHRHQGEGPVVVGVDCSEGSHRVLKWAVEEAELRDVSLVVVSTWQMPPLAAWAFAPESPYFEKLAEARATSLDEVLAKVDTGTLDVERRVDAGSAAAALLTAERDVDASLLVVGSRGLPSLQGALLGSVSRQVVHHALGTVLVVRP
jgi:nucleotide-binding universal stress UspA family protein